jgi:hypothetical protein
VHGADLPELSRRVLDVAREHGIFLDALGPVEPGLSDCLWLRAHGEGA